MASTIKSNTIDTVDNTALTIKQNDTTAITVDTSQNVLVGTTDTSIYNNSGSGQGGASINIPSSGSGYVQVARDSGTALYLNRLVNDGAIIDVRQNGTQVGTIGADASSIYIAGVSRGLRFTGSQLKTTDATGNNQDNQYDLGSSTTRFKDFYLGGNIYLGGTGGANALDDYEEGTWSPAFSGESGSPSGVTYPTRTGYYTKIGNLVFISVDLEVSSWSSGPSGNLIITTLPFTSSGSNYQSAISISRVSGFTSTGAPSGGRIATSQTSIKLVKKASSDARDNMVTAVSSSDASGNERITLAGFYQTDS